LKIKTDILVIGSGIAGLWFALKASKYADVLIVTKKEKAESNTNYAQGGIASVMAPDDNFELHIQDTLEAGAGLCHLDAVRQIVEEGPLLIKQLIKLGTDFSKHNGTLDLGREGGHSRERIVHSKDLTGKEIERALLHQVAVNKKIQILEHHTAVELITEHHLLPGRIKNINNTVSCYGAYAFDEMQNQITAIQAKITAICSGGIGQVYLHTTNPDIATGDGIAMAYRCGCKIGNMEFVQFHPTSLYETNRDKKSQAFLISEALRGAGAILRSKNGDSFMEKYDKRGSLAPRDIVARAIDNEMKKYGVDYVYLDVTHVSLNKLKTNFPNIYKRCFESGINIKKDYIPVVPAAHYMCGGIVSDLRGRTSLNHLYALGEAAMTGVHGANRLASNSLLEALVYADKASQDCRQYFEGSKNQRIKDKVNVPEWDETGTVNTEEWILISQDKMEIKQIMSNYVGIVRSDLRLHRALRRITLINDEIEIFYKKTKISRELLELRNIALIAYLITKSALSRKESRGLHYSTDYPVPKKRYLRDTIIEIK
jgi:L-aspartate oxidase